MASRVLSLKHALLLLVFVTASACNHLFYYPSPQTFTTPDKFDLRSQAFSVRTEDGETLAFWHLAATPPKVGTILHFHGNAENMTSHFLFVAWLTHFGFDVFTFDYRGYGASTGSPSREGLVIDGATAIREMERRGEPFSIVAQSLGGAVAVPSVVLAAPESLQALVLESTFGSYRDMARDKLSSVWLTWPLQYPLSFLVSDDYSPLDYAPKLEIPTLVIHGDADGVVGIAHGRALYDVIPSDEKDFWRLQGGGHTVAFLDPESPFRGKLVEYLCLHSEQRERCLTPRPMPSKTN